MKKLILYLFLVLLYCCKENESCDPCKEFLKNHKPFKYEMQRYSYARGLAFPANPPSQWYEDLHNPEDEMAIMKSQYFKNIEDSLFCFTHMHYDDVMEHFPPNADSIIINDIDSKTVLMECNLNVGDWDLIRSREKYIPYTGSPTLKLLFKNEDEQLIYVGGIVSREKYESCLIEE